MDDVPIAHIQLLGEFRLWSSCGAMASTTWRRKPASLVTLLALAPGHKLPCERVMETLWPDLSDRAATNNLHQTLHLARRALPRAAPELLRFRDKQLVLAEPGRVRVDVDAFVEQAAKAKRDRESASYQRALALYTGDLLPEERHEDWVIARREDLCSLYLDLLIALGQRREEEGNHPGALEAYHQTLEREPALEEAHLGVMRAHHALGQRHEALRQYGRLRQVLWREFEAEPERQSQELYQRVLAQSYHPEKQRNLEPLEESTLLAAPVANVVAPAASYATKPPLSPRERETARLIARGLTNRRLAAELGVGVRTVDTLLSRILRKLRLRSRAEIVRWLAEQDHEPR